MNFEYVVYLYSCLEIHWKLTIFKMEKKGSEIFSQYIYILAKNLILNVWFFQQWAYRWQSVVHQDYISWDFFVPKNDSITLNWTFSVAKYIRGSRFFGNIYIYIYIEWKKKINKLEENVEERDWRRKDRYAVWRTRNNKDIGRKKEVRER